MNTAIIVAGGSGSRMNSEKRKQYLLLNGIPVLRLTLEVFAASDMIDRICLVVPEEDIDYCKEAILGKQEKTVVVSGGKERQNSVRNGLAALINPSDDDIILIHDGVRPFVHPDDIRLTIEAAVKYGAAIMALPAYDTVKEADDCLMIKRTISREKIWYAQTPQAFRYSVISRAHRRASENGRTGTDDASLVEMDGGVVKIIAGRKTNIKITTPDDILIADAMIQSK